MEIRQALREQSPSLALQRAASDEIALLDSRLQTAIYRIQDLMKNDDGQAWKEARKFLQTLGVPDESIP